MWQLRLPYLKTRSGQEPIRYYRCHKYDPIAAGGRDRVCQERQARANELDEIVFEQVRATLLRPDVLWLARPLWPAEPRSPMTTCWLGQLEGFGAQAAAG